MQALPVLEEMMSELKWALLALVTSLLMNAAAAAHEWPSVR